MRRPELVVSIGKARATQTASVRDAVLVHLDALCRFALRLSRDADQAYDLTHDAVLRALAHEAAPIRDPRAWLFRTLYHSFIDHCRKRGRFHPRRRETSDFEGSSEEPEQGRIMDPLPTLMVVEDVRSALDNLLEEFRVVVWLSDAEEFRLQEIAEILGCPLGTVASRLARGRRELRRLLATYSREQERSS